MSTIEFEPAAKIADFAPAPDVLAARHPTYQPIHKALRAFMARVLVDLGNMDPQDSEECRATLGQARNLLDLLDLLASHLSHENEFIHPALESLQRGSSARVDEDHGSHITTIEALTTEVQALLDTCACSPVPARAEADALRLYRRFALFVAENFEHMHHEETALHALLCAGYSDAELQTIHARLLASVPPAELMGVLRWMLPAVTPAQRIGMLTELKTQVPPEAMHAVIDLAHRVLDARAWVKLASALGLAPVPGPVQE